jgi:hypothetical protein
MDESQQMQCNKRPFIRYLIKAFHCNFSTHKTLYHTCPFNRLPEDEHSVSKHVEDIKIILLV